MRQSVADGVVTLGFTVVPVLTTENYKEKYCNNDYSRSVAKENKTQYNSIITTTQN